MDEFIKYALDEAITPLSAGVTLIAAIVIALLQRSYLRQIAVLRKEMKTRNSQLAELQEILHLSKVSELQSKVANLNPQPRRRLTPQQKSGLAEYGKGPPRADGLLWRLFTTWQALIAVLMPMTFVLCSTRLLVGQ